MFDIGLPQRVISSLFTYIKGPRRARRSLEHEALNSPTDCVGLEPAKKVPAGIRADALHPQPPVSLGSARRGELTWGRKKGGEGSNRHTVERDPEYMLIVRLFQEKNMGFCRFQESNSYD